MRAGCWPVLAGLTVLSAASFARAETTPSDRALAQSLFDEGRAFMEDGKYHEACDRFARSLKLDAGGGTLLNLAVCHEKEGRVATAYVEHNTALSQALREGRTDREALARKRIAALAPIVPRVRISFEGEAPAGLTLTLDGAPLPADTLGAPLPIDPGSHVVEARAPGKKGRSVTIAIEEGPRVVELGIPALANDDTPEPRAVAVPVITPDHVEPEPHGSGRRTTGYILGGAGVAAIAVGTVFGITALQKNNESSTLCATDRCSDPRAVSLSSQAVTSAWVSDIAIAAGVVAVGVGIYLVLTAPASPSKRAFWRSTEIRF